MKNSFFYTTLLTIMIAATTATVQCMQSSKQLMGSAGKVPTKTLKNAYRANEKSSNKSSNRYNCETGCGTTRGYEDDSTDGSSYSDCGDCGNDNNSSQDAGGCENGQCELPRRQQPQNNCANGVCPMPRKNDCGPAGCGSDESSYSSDYSEEGESDESNSDDSY